MRDELSSPPLSELRTYREIPEDIAVALAEKLVDPHVGPIVALETGELEPGSTGELHRYATLIQNTAAFSDTGYWEPDTTGGSGLSATDAKMTALGEAIERYCLSLCDLDEFRTGAYDDLTVPAVHPLEINKFTEDQLADRGLSQELIETAEYHWTATRALTSGEEVLIPGQLVYVPFDPPLTIRSPITTGAAAGIDYETTLYRAICEVIERECFIIGYLNKLPYPHIDITSVDDPVVQTIISELDSLGRDVHLLDISLDHPLTTYLAIIVNSRTEPALSLGMECDADQITAIRGALLEAYQFSDWSPEIDETADEANAIETIPQRAQYWERFENLSELDFWLATDKSVELKRTHQPDNKRKETVAIDQFIMFLERKNLECYVADATTPDIRKNSFRVLKAIIPELHPMHLREQFKYIGGERLYQVPVDVGYLETRHTRDQLNKVPHPFL